MEVIKEENGVIKVDCAPFELALEINTALVRYGFTHNSVDKEKYEKEIRESCLKVINLTKELLGDVPEDLKEHLPQIKLIEDEERLLRFLRLE